MAFFVSALMDKWPLGFVIFQARESLPFDFAQGQLWAT
jgi:hypothetical protein